MTSPSLRRGIRCRRIQELASTLMLMIARPLNICRSKWEQACYINYKCLTLQSAKLGEYWRPLHHIQSSGTDKAQFSRTWRITILSHIKVTMVEHKLTTTQILLRQNYSRHHKSSRRCYSEHQDAVSSRGLLECSIFRAAQK